MAEFTLQPFDDRLDLVEGALLGGTFGQFAKHLFAQSAQGGIDQGFQRGSGEHDSSSPVVLKRQIVIEGRFALCFPTHCQHPQSHPPWNCRKELSYEMSNVRQQAQTKLTRRAMRFIRAEECIRVEA
jgi:hypothetical protein